VCRRLFHQGNQQRGKQKTHHDEVESIGKCLGSRLPQRQRGKIFQRRRLRGIRRDPWTVKFAALR
jgi:hypothetical protein